MSDKKHFRVGLLVAGCIIVLDQLSKWWVVTDLMQPPRTIPVTSFFNFVMGWNRGISFGMFNSSGALNQWLLPILALAIVAVLLVWMWRMENRLLAISVGLIVGGAIGNVIDRFRYGAVADFLDFHVAGYHWPAFNVADSGITVGAIILVLDSLFGDAERHKNKEEKDGTANDAE